MSSHTINIINNCSCLIRRQQFNTRLFEFFDLHLCSIQFSEWLFWKLSLLFSLLILSCLWNDVSACWNVWELSACVVILGSVSDQMIIQPITLNELVRCFPLALRDFSYTHWILIFWWLTYFKNSLFCNHIFPFSLRANTFIHPCNIRIQMLIEVRE